MKLINKTFIIAAAATLTTACTDYDNNYDDRKIAYEEAFKDVFGNIDPKQDWTMAKQISANVDLTNVNGECTVTVYDKAPMSNKASILYRSNVNGGGNYSFSFDAPKSNKNVYVQIKDAKGLTPISNYFDIEGDQLNARVMGLKTRAGNGVTLGAPLSDELMGKFQDNHDYWHSLHANEHNSDINYNQLYNTYSLSNVTTTDGGSVMISDIDEIVGKGGVFNERNNMREECNLSKWYNDLNAEKGAEYILAANGPVEFDFMYGGTANNNKIGYFYYSDGKTYEEAIRMPHYIIGSGRPQDNVKINGATMATGEGMKLPALVESYDALGADVKLTGTHYKLTYFGESGLDEANASYEFPAGTHVVFFLIQNGMLDNITYGPKIENSVPKFNALENKFWVDNCHHTNNWHTGDHATSPDLTGELDAVTYRWGGMTILGFEDRDEYDMNDILLFVQGNFKNEIKELKEETDAYEWVVACEDLGSSDISDIDFNDVVFGVKHYTSSKTMYSKYYDEHGILVSTGLPKIIDKENYLVVTPKAAGGTLKSHIFYDTRNLGEIHSLLDPSTNYSSVLSGNMPMLNTRNLSYTGTPIIIELAENEDFTMAGVSDGATSVSKFSIIVARDETDKERNTEAEHAVKISKPTTGRAPQMLILPIGWDWPTERTNIATAYPSFSTWVGDADEYDWITPCNGPVITNPVKTYNTSGGGSSTGGGSNSTTYTLTIPDTPTDAYSTDYSSQVAYTFDVSGPEIDWEGVNSAKLCIETADNNKITIYAGNSWNVFHSSTQGLQTPVTTGDIYKWGFETNKTFSVFSQTSMTITKCQLILTKSSAQ